MTQPEKKTEPQADSIEQALAEAKKQNRKALGKAIVIGTVIVLFYLLFRYL